MTKLKGHHKVAVTHDFNPYLDLQNGLCTEEHTTENIDDQSSFCLENELYLKPYKDIVAVAAQNPAFTHEILNDNAAKPTSVWESKFDELTARMEEFKKAGDRDNYYSAYSSLLDELYKNSGLEEINKLIEKIEHEKNVQGVLPDSTLDDLKNASSKGIFEKLTAKIPATDKIFRHDPEVLSLLYEHKERAERLFVGALNEKFRVNDPLIHWMPFVTLAVNGRERPNREILKELYLKARQNAVDNAMRVLFEIEYGEHTGVPTSLEEYSKYYSTIGYEISGLAGTNAGTISENPLFNETPAEKEERYYSVLGRVWLYKYTAELSAFTPNLQTARNMEENLRSIITKRRDKASLNEAQIYANAVSVIMNAWSEKNGLISHTFWTRGLEIAKNELMRLGSIAKEADTLANGFVRESAGDGLKDMIAEIRCKAGGEAYFSAGLPAQAVSNLESEPIFYRKTASYENYLIALREKYPWLAGENGRLSLDNVGEHGNEAYELTKSAFLESKNMGREIGIPTVLTIAGSFAGPLGSLGGGLAGKGVNRAINLGDNEVKEVLSEAKATGIPLISKELANELNKNENIDWFLCGLGGLATFKFSRSFLSLSRAGTEAVFDYLKSGGLKMSLLKAGGAVKTGYTNLPVWPQAVSSSISNGIRSIPSAFTGLSRAIFEKYGSFGFYNALKYAWTEHGALTRITAGATLMLQDYRKDKEFNDWSGPLGASLIINDIYGHWIWGWNPNGGMSAFIWRYGIIVGVQAMQGQDISTPNFTYTTVGMLGSYTARGVNKLWTLGRAEARASRLTKWIARFCERRNVLVPLSVRGRSAFKGAWGLVQGVAMRVGKPFKPPAASYSDGHILRVTSTSNGTSYILNVFRKMTGKGGVPIAVESTETARRAGPIGRWFSRTLYYKLGDSWVYKIPNIVLGPVTKMLPKGARSWWQGIGKIKSSTSRPIFNFRGSVANLEDIPVIMAVNALAGVFQGADPIMMGLYTAVDYSISYFAQHKVQHLLKIDSFLGVSLGYALGLPFSVGWPISLIPLPKIFPTIVNTGRGLENKKNGYYKMLEDGYFGSADKSLKSSITSLCFVKGMPIVGELWNAVTPLGSVTGSNVRIEETGAIAFWQKQLEYTAKAEAELKAAKIDYAGNIKYQMRIKSGRNLIIMANFMEKTCADAQGFYFDGKLPKDPVHLRLNLLELTFLKKLAEDTSRPFLASLAKAYIKPIGDIMKRIPDIADEEELAHFIKKLNDDVLE